MGVNMVVLVLKILSVARRHACTTTPANMKWEIPIVGSTGSSTTRVVIPNSVQWAIRSVGMDSSISSIAVFLQKNFYESEDEEKLIILADLNDLSGGCRQRHNVVLNKRKIWRT